MDSDPQRDLEKLVSIRDTLEKKSHQLEENASRLSANFVIFCSIMWIPSIMASNSSLERSKWILFCFSASVSISFWLMIINTVNHGMNIRYEWDLISMQKERLHRNICYMQNGQDGTALAAAFEQDLKKPFAVARYKRYAYVGAVLSGLFSSTVLLLYELSSRS